MLYNAFMKTDRRSRISLRLILLLGTALLLLVMELLGAFPKITTPLERVEWVTRDSLMRLRGLQKTSGQIVIVGIDDDSLAWNNEEWPWPRAYDAEIIQRLNDAGARLIGIDLMLAAKGVDIGGDEALAAALSQTRQSVSVMQVTKSSGVGFAKDAAKPPEQILADELSAFGLTSVILDGDAVERRIQPFDFANEDVYFNWAFDIASLSMGVDRPSFNSSGKLVFNGQEVPLAQGNLLINYAGPAGTYPTYAAAYVHDGLVDPAVFKDKIVLFGATSISLKDNFPTPYSTTVLTPGVEMIANAVDMLMSGRYLRVTPPWLNLLLIVLVAVLASLVGRIRRPALTLSLMAGIMLVYFGLCYFAFASSGWYLPIMGPETMLFLGVVLPNIEQAISQEMEKRRVRNMFTRFIDPEMVDQLLATRDINSLNKRADLTILFSDIRGFTTLSEKLVPIEVVHLLNPYLEVMTEVILRNGGTVDKYEGDAIVAFFGEPVIYPDHALRAARAAVEMRTALAELKERWRREGRLPAHFEIGIGLNTGDAFVGLLGSEQRINYTVIGDNVNLAARLQDLTKQYVWPIIISESTALAIQDEFDVEFIEAANVKGKSEPVKVYKVLGRKGAPESEQVRALEI